MYLDLKYVVLHQHIILWLLFKVSLFSACYYKVRTVSYMYLKLQAAQHIWFSKWKKLHGNKTQGHHMRQFRYCSYLTGGASGKESARQCRRHGTQAWFLGWEDPSEEEMATHSSILAWEISWTEEPGRLRSTRLQRAGHDWAYTHKTMRMRVLWIFFIKVLSSSHVWKKLIYICILCEGMSF